MLYAVAMGTGFRAAELASLAPRSFDLDADPHTASVDAAYSKRAVAGTCNRYHRTWPQCCG